MATKKTENEILDESMVFHVEEKQEGYKGPKVRIFLPKLEDSGDNGISVDQYEHVTIANEVKEEHFRIHRGEWVEIPAYVYVVLKAKYPDL